MSWPTASLVIYISSYPARPRRITVNYYFGDDISVNSLATGKTNQ